MTDHRVPGSLETVMTIAALTWKRLARGRALWVGVIISSLLVPFASAVRSSGNAGTGEELIMFALLTLAVVPPMFVSSSIGEEIEERTTTYLWSRPVPRWTVLAGKLATLVPVTIVLAVGSWSLAMLVGPQRPPSPESCLALAAGVTAISMMAAGIATLVPKHGMPLSICYMLFFDLPIGAMPISLSELSITHHVYTLTGMFRDGATMPRSLLALAILCAVWGTVAIWRIRRLEV
ncbi:MAG: ABC transporter permease [Deltaproteobacteria bacterium]|nr:ABC transporter permease [Deltaproteobacteria bacterium]MDQ3300266.1 ABC transporter permease [Myxococcota bacterium]